MRPASEAESVIRVAWLVLTTDAPAIWSTHVEVVPSSVAPRDGSKWAIAPRRRNSSEYHVRANGAKLSAAARFKLARLVGVGTGYDAMWTRPFEPATAEPEVWL